MEFREAVRRDMYGMSQLNARDRDGAVVFPWRLAADRFGSIVIQHRPFTSISDRPPTTPLYHEYTSRHAP